MNFQKYTDHNQSFIVELDDVLYPEKDYLLQVYYLFAQFIEYTEQIAGAEIVSFMEQSFLQEGTDGIYERTAEKFGLGEKYRVNFDLLQQNARLPLKLLLFAPVLSLLQEIKATGKPLFLLIEGDPAKQLNKIRQIEWNGLEQYLKVYFAAETVTGSAGEMLDIIVMEHQLKAKEVLLIGKDESHKISLKLSEINFLPVNKLFVS